MCYQRDSMFVHVVPPVRPSDHTLCEGSVAEVREAYILSSCSEASPYPPPLRVSRCEQRTIAAGMTRRTLRQARPRAFRPTDFLTPSPLSLPTLAESPSDPVSRGLWLFDGKSCDAISDAGAGQSNVNGLSSDQGQGQGQ